MSELELAQARIAQLEELVRQLQAQLAWFKKHAFGTGKSERQDALQMQLKLESNRRR